MSSRRFSAFPPAAVQWLAGSEPARVLDVGSGDGRLAQALVAQGHRVTCVDVDQEGVRRLADRVPDALTCVAQAESLPLRSFRFDVVTVQESLTRFAPGLALSEFARVLRGTGHLAVVFTSRDDTVPWVKRLARRIQEDDPTAMVGDYGRETLAALEDSEYFPHIEARAFRHWLPIDRAGLLAMVRRRPTIAALPQDRLDGLLADVGEMYDSLAKAPDPLLLPYQADCRRLRVEHGDLTMPIHEDGLRISVRF
ncbi:MAG TPA: methyltransferase domain-containing protein [Propionibacterium sp.]|jgi:SAM-dependent methyltransferase|nr:methyltransferase domain-containing protein [Propionibacterium sp.]